MPTLPRSSSARRRARATRATRARSRGPACSTPPPARATGPQRLARATVRKNQAAEMGGASIGCATTDFCSSHTRRNSDHMPCGQLRLCLVAGVLAARCQPVRQRHLRQWLHRRERRCVAPASVPGHRRVHVDRAQRLHSYGPQPIPNHRAQGNRSCRSPCVAVTSCDPGRTCAAETAFSATWPTAFSDTTVVGVCGAGFYNTGAPLRYCQLSGVWATSVTNPCVGACRDGTQLGREGGRERGRASGGASRRAGA